MKSIPLFAFTLYMILNFPMFAQDEDGQQIVIYEVPANIAVNKMPWYKDVYLFSDFQAGTVVYASRRKDNETLKLNYNLYYEKVECINKQGDTVLLKTQKLKFVTIGGTPFLFDNVKGFIEIVGDAPVALGVKTFMVGNFGNDLRTSPSAYDRRYIKNVSYFFIDRRTSVHKAIKPSILKLFAPYAEKINEYLETNPVDFNRQEDLIRLLNFCHSLRHT
ncbi:hypothetical protein [Chryseolinea sp. H1M3-3]|uniref:hypothetical protein n=1 Tax=Chryseolinea sp. H1M3-3 TaxID=3034144 RepID=UPI0023ED885C|nr:hypothetical protein [Chryseolinea sp. H1M3-3]